MIEYLICFLKSSRKNVERYRILFLIVSRLTFFVLCNLHKKSKKKMVDKLELNSRKNVDNWLSTLNRRRKKCAKWTYTQSYPHYPQKCTMSVVYKKKCQVRKFVLLFVINLLKMNEN